MQPDLDNVADSVVQKCQSKAQQGPAPGDKPGAGLGMGLGGTIAKPFIKQAVAFAIQEVVDATQINQDSVDALNAAGQANLAAIIQRLVDIRQAADAFVANL